MVKLIKLLQHAENLLNVMTNLTTDTGLYIYSRVEHNNLSTTAFITKLKNFYLILTMLFTQQPLQHLQ